MFCAFFTLLLVLVALGVLLWLGWQRVSTHLRRHPEAAKLLAEHVITPLLTGGQPESQPEANKSKGTLI